MNAGNALFLRAGRQADGVRTFKLLEGEPLPTSFGEDLYKRIFLLYQKPHIFTIVLVVLPLRLL